MAAAADVALGRSLPESFKIPLFTSGDHNKDVDAPEDDDRTCMSTVMIVPLGDRESFVHDVEVDTELADRRVWEDCDKDVVRNLATKFWGVVAAVAQAVASREDDDTNPGLVLLLRYQEDGNPMITCAYGRFTEDTSVRQAMRPFLQYANGSNSLLAWVMCRRGFESAWALETAGQVTPKATASAKDVPRFAPMSVELRILDIDKE